MASEQFSLCWDNFHKNMSSGMNSLLENEDLVDVTLAVEGKCLKAHKMVLSVCSPYFRELFKSNPCKHPIVFMKDVSYIAMSDLLQFMYQGEVQVSQENLTTFIKTAEALQIKGLTGDGNGSGDCDNEQDESRAVEIEMPKLTPPTPRPVKKMQHTSAPPTKRPRLSAPEPSSSSASQTVTKTEPAPVASASTNENLIQFKMEPYDQSQSAVTITEDNPEESFGDDPLDDTNADDGNEDYSMMEGGDDEPQAGTSADGAAGEGQDVLSRSLKIEYEEETNDLDGDDEGLEWKPQEFNIDDPKEHFIVLSPLAANSPDLAVGQVRGKEVYIGRGVFISLEDYKKIIYRSRTTQNFVRGMSLAVFGRETLARSSVAGKPDKPGLDPNRLKAIKDITRHYLRLKNLTEENVEKELRRLNTYVSRKINEVRRKQGRRIKKLV